MTVEPEAIMAYIADDPSYEGFPHDLLVETWGFQLFYTVWQAHRLADELEMDGHEEIAAALRQEFDTKATEARRRMDEARDDSLRRMGFIP